MESPPVAACAAFAVFDIKSVERIKLGGHGLAPPISAAARTMARRVAERGFPSIRSSSNGTDPRSPTWTNTWLGELGRLRLNPIFIASRSASPSSSSGFHRMVGSAISALPSRSHSQIEYPAAFAASSNRSWSVFLGLLVVMGGLLALEDSPALPLRFSQHFAECNNITEPLPRIVYGQVHDKSSSGQRTGHDDEVADVKRQMINHYSPSCLRWAARASVALAWRYFSRLVPARCQDAPISSSAPTSFTFSACISTSVLASPRLMASSSFAWACNCSALVSPVAPLAMRLISRQNSSAV